MRRIFLISVLFLLSLTILTAGIGWYLLSDEAFLKSQLHDQVLKYTGRELTVNGPLQLSLGRETTLIANDVHFANPSWASRPDMVSIGYLLVTVEVATLFGDRPVFPAVTVDDCEVGLVRNEAGEPNWKMHPQADPKPETETEKPARNKLPIWIKNIRLSKCELNIASTRLEYPLDIKVADLAMLHRDDSRWEANASGSLNEQAINFDGWFAPFDAIVYGGPLEHELNFSIGDILTLKSSGSVQDAKTWAGANINTEFKGPEIADILNELKLPLFTEGAFDYRLSLNSEGSMTKIDLSGDLGSVDIVAKGELDQLVRPTKGDVELSVDGPNLGALAKILGMDGLVEDEFNNVTHAAFEGDKIHFKKVTLSTASDHLEIGGHFGTAQGFGDSDLDIQFTTREIGRWAGTVGQSEVSIGPLSLNGKLSSDANGLFSIQSKVVQDQTNLDLNGQLGILVEAFQPDFQVSFQSNDPSPLAEIAGLTGIPAAPLAIKGRFAMKDRQITLDKFNINLAGNQADIDGLINLEDRHAGSDLRLDFDIKDAGAFGRLFGQDGLPDQPLKLSAEVKPEGKGLTFQTRDGNLGAIQIEFDGKIEDLEKLKWIDANFDIYLPRLSGVSFLFPKTRLPDAPFTAKGEIESKDQQILFNKVKVTLADNQAHIDGYIYPENRYAGSRVNFELDIKSVGGLGRMFGKDGLPDEPMKLIASIEPAGNGLDFKVTDGDIRDIEMELNGHIADLDQPMGIEATFDVRLPSLRDVSFLFPNRKLPDQPFTAKGILHNETSKTSLDGVNLKLGPLAVSVEGNLFPDNRFDLSIKGAGPDASVLGELIGTSLPAEPFSLATGLSGMPSRFELKDLDVDLGRSQVDGNLSIALEDIKQFEGQLDSPHLDLSHWYSDEETTETPKKNTNKKWMFDDTPVMRLAEHNLDIDLDLAVDELYLGNTTLKEIAVEFELSHQLLEFNPFTLKGSQGGAYRGEFSLDSSSGTPRLHLNMSGSNVRLGLASVPGQDPSTYPPMEIELALDGAGATRREMASSLTGKYRGYLGSGQVAKAGLDLLFSDFLTQLFTTLNPFAKTSEYTQLDCAVLAADADSGLVKLAPLLFNTEQLTVLSEGTIDLNSEKINLSFNTKPRTGLGLSGGALINQLIKVGGTLTAPAIQIDPAGTITSGGLAVATLGISVLAKSLSDRYLSSSDPCGEARKEIDKRESKGN